MICSLLFFCVITSCLATIPRPRGVSISMASWYKPGAEFRCIDGSKSLPFEYINDDYCDCPDGSDEPGTSACPGGKFHCTNAGFKPLNILSSRVGDGICDCCDGTDEWEGNIECVNNCKELGKKMREEAELVRQLQEQGHTLKLQYMETGKKTRAVKKTELEELQKTKVELETVKNEMEQKKNEAETPEKEAKEKHEQAWKEELEKIKAAKDKVKAETAFYEMDENKDNRVDLAEVKAHSQFDVDNNGEVCDTEAREHLELGDEDTHVDMAHFIEKVWPNIREFYKSPSELQAAAKGEKQGEVPEAPKANIPNTGEYLENEDDDEEDEEEDIEYDEEGHAEPHATPTAPPSSTMETPVLVPPTIVEEENKEKPSVADDEKMPDYDELTKQLMAVADVARNQFTEAEKKLKDTESQIRNLETYLGIDYGPNEEFSVLKGNCYEYTDREYTYKMCGFDKATQRSKSGGSETTLGNWGKWDGPAHDKYAIMNYENGQSCWNGPNRSVKVHLKCGTDNKLTGASEPSRCEYAFDFETPSRCSEPPTTHQLHTEL
ncbi:glucosidase 2 subunit beta-like isoform X2 [Dreissena polymorpha]|uniref:glucosidase 2 subunit beta-like isoform X2 n=1 Tax=Dreissena polymorpha TaxID=45954 RepID=UPI002264A545|nr:glucosidase 2 subunit beta-like isoform X2 [Dreissena polymorpha]